MLSPASVMPSATLQSRIKAFEALSGPQPSPSTPTYSHSAATKPGKYSSASLLETPISPTASSFRPIAPQRSPSRSPSPSPPNLGRKTSLIDLGDWIVDDGPTPATTPSRNTNTNGNGNERHLNSLRAFSRTPPHRKPAPSTSTPLINFESPPKTRPPLPPRKPSYNASESKSPRGVGATLRPPNAAVEHTYPPSASNSNGFGSARLGHAPASSVSSFHSVSLSSDGGTADHPPRPSSSKDADADTASLAESFENISVTSAISPSTAPSPSLAFNWDLAIANAKREPPKLPQRPGSRSPIVAPSPAPRTPSASSSSSGATTNTRRPPPPPPSRPKPPSSRASLASTSASISDRSSVLSMATTTSRTSISTRNSNSVKLTRPTPVPPAARVRYEAVFVGCVLSRRKAEKARAERPALLAPPAVAKKGRQAAGWRGLSVDLITNPEDHPLMNVEDAAQDGGGGRGKGKSPDSGKDSGGDECATVGPEEKLGGQVVRLIWSASKLDRGKLRDIWNDCDPQASGALDRDAFVKGMWRIDEELRRAQLSRRTSALSIASKQRIPHRPRVGTLLLQ
ncbi:hypothetical protein BJ138DRAFT_1088641 [Hygrophoropsis aurantiaca]|uniref:Uncharacterized protein n=1 Tax=Hygrophoropsis aurantiaca TaxID=72124 RepID=A0ACB8AB22_9AGAM|nr:hypothetical protein BJ138DRAFT_1088641 [Hygrophoropsis aurantiaca]